MGGVTRGHPATQVKALIQSEGKYLGGREEWEELPWTTGGEGDWRLWGMGGGGGGTGGLSQAKLGAPRRK